MDENISLKDLRKMAAKRGIKNIFTDNNFRTFQILEAMDIHALPKRQGHDAIDYLSRLIQIKTSSTYEVFSTSHHLSHDIIIAYRETSYWLFGLFSENSVLMTHLYIVETKYLEPYFKKWEADIASLQTENKKASLNDPRILLSYVKSVGKEIKSTDWGRKTKEIFEKYMTNPSNKSCSEWLAVCEEALEQAKQASSKGRDDTKEALKAVLRKMEGILHPSKMQEFLVEIQQETNIDVKIIINQNTTPLTSVTDTNVPPTQLPLPTPAASVPDTELGKTFYLFLTTQFTLDPAGSISDAKMTRLFRAWFWDTYRTKPPVKNAQTSKLCYAALGVKRNNDSGKITGLKEKDETQPEIVSA